MRTKSRKALSPVVASIILIAVTVAVSIAVAAWMGALSFGFMATEELKITNMQFGTYTNGTQTMLVTMLNSGTNPVTITEVHINNGVNLLQAQFTVNANSNGNANVTQSWTAGSSYEVEARSSKGNQFTYRASAPT